MGTASELLAVPFESMHAVLLFVVCMCPLVCEQLISGTVGSFGVKQCMEQILPGRQSGTPAIYLKTKFLLLLLILPKYHAHRYT